MSEASLTRFARSDFSATYAAAELVLDGGAGGCRAVQPGLQAQDRLGVELRDAGLGDAEHLADFAEGQLLVVVEGDHELLALGQAGDRLAERFAELGRVERLRRLRAMLVLDR